MPHRLLRIFLIVGVLLALAAACGSDDERVEAADDMAAAEAHDDDTTTDDTHDDTTTTDDTHDDTTTTDEAVDLVVTVSMIDFGYELDTTEIPAGSTVRFDFVNIGAIEHEAMFGDAHQQEEYALDTDHEHHGAPEEGHHGEIHAITLDVGESGSLVVTFDEPGEMLIGCHIPGHWDAGMVSTVQIV